MNIRKDFQSNNIHICIKLTLKRLRRIIQSQAISDKIKDELLTLNEYMLVLKIAIVFILFLLLFFLFQFNLNLVE